MEETVQVFVNVDKNGDILSGQIGQNIAASEDFDFFFMVSPVVAEELDKYKVQLDGFKKSLVLKEGAMPNE
ncbi:hypothetical protein [Planococcus versutus]|uniref:Uncharacterized protein n=1 Tax=Planococcus versutus TaxID=1302659 RepID=A0A1B1S5K3_9BACL|nr:hypothetical protein [Planococcus versutus]ANU28463.1 hypothetical protein I858_015850 [Planococcus versutus]